MSAIKLKLFHCLNVRESFPSINWQFNLCHLYLFVYTGTQIAIDLIMSCGHIFFMAILMLLLKIRLYALHTQQLHIKFMFYSGELTIWNFNASHIEFGGGAETNKFLMSFHTINEQKICQKIKLPNFQLQLEL